MRKLTLSCAGLALLVMAAVPGHAHAARYAPMSPRDQGIAAIHWASARWHVNYWWLYRIASRESGLYPSAYNHWSGASGLFQFLPSTYWPYARRIGETRSIFNAYANANVAAYMFSIGLSYAWNE